MTHSGYALEAGTETASGPETATDIPIVSPEPEPLADIPIVQSDPSLSIVVIGDSYTHTQHGAIENPWPEQLQKLLGLPDSQFVISRKGTAGFSYGYHFRKLLMNVPPSDTVTMVLVVGGLGNDLRVTDTKVRSGFRLFTKLAHERFPNASLFYAAPNWAMKHSRQSKEAGRIPLYQKLCLKYGWVFLEQTTNTMHNAMAIRFWFGEDTHHPNQLGHDAIARNIYQEILQKLDTLKYTHIE